MDYTQPGFWIALGIGGVVVASLGTFQQYQTKESEQPLKIRAIFRDFFIGAFLTSLLYMLIPDSIESVISQGTELISKTTSSAKSLAPELELRTGPARF